MSVQVRVFMAAATLLLSSCLSADEEVHFRQAQSQTCSDTTTPIFAGQHTEAGEVTVTNDADNLIVSASTQGGWAFAEIHLYAGTGPVPTNNAGAPLPGKFPYKVYFPAPFATEHVFTIPLVDLGISCGDALNVAFHAALVRLDDEGNVIGAETGWGLGEPFAKGWGWSFQHTTCCRDDGCTLTQGYWKNHDWPASEINNELCGQSWSSILATPAGGDAWTILAHQYIAARLNLASGAASTPEVYDAVAEANLLLEGCTISAADRGQALAIKDVLDAYNNGDIGPGHCED